MKKPRIPPKYYTVLILAFGLLSLWVTVFMLNLIEADSPRAEHLLRDITLRHGFIGIALISYLSATLIPFPGDTVFLAAIKLSTSPIIFFLINLALSTLGALTNFFLARILRKKWVVKYVDEDHLAVATGWLVTYGPVALVAAGISLIPFLFDPMTFILGMSSMRTERFFRYCLLAKFLHFLVLALIAFRFVI